MKKELYGTPAMVKEFRKHKIKTKGELPDFLETIKIMGQEGALSEDPLPLPELSGEMSKEEFMEAYDQVPFNAGLILDISKIAAMGKKHGVMFRNGKDVSCVQHIHDYGYREQPAMDFFAVTYLYRGRLSCVFKERQTELKEGDLLIVTPRFVHGVHAYPDTYAFEALIDAASFHIVFNDFLAAHSRFSDFFGNAILSEEDNYCIIHGEEDDRELRFYLQSFARECENKEPYSNSCAVSLMKLFLSLAYRRYARTMEFYRDDFRNRKMDAESLRLYIRNHFMDITLEETARYFHYNPAYLSRYIRNHFQKSFMELVTELKMEHAREYLKKTSKHISDIALLVGYDSADHFSRMFRKYTGMSPAMFRKHSRAGLSGPGERSD